ncbi:MAG: thioredoxin family protein [Nocardioidaceae bacterium]|nr:thioredoxin family protein [Nocardioidaceae bacterium]
MRVELLYFDGCPNWRVADDRLAEALAALGRTDVVVERRLVETPEQAEELAFLGSPTIRIDGADPFATGQEQVGLACRVYATPAGLSGSPDTAQLVEVLS